MHEPAVGVRVDGVDRLNKFGVKPGSGIGEINRESTIQSRRLYPTRKDGISELLNFLQDHTQAMRDGFIALFTGNTVAFLVSEGPTMATLAKGAVFSMLSGLVIKAAEIAWQEYRKKK